MTQPTTLILLKLLLSPILIAFVTLVGRRWGPGIGGWLMGFPLTSGPVSILLLLEYGRAFAAHAAASTLGGQASVCIFCLTYAVLSTWTGWPLSAAGSVAAFLLSVFLWNAASLSLIPAVAAFLVISILVLRMMPRRDGVHSTAQPPRWDLPARMTAAAVFVLLLTTFADLLGPQVSGLLSPFPLFGVIITSFTHHQQGVAAASQVVRGVAWGSFAFNAFSWLWPCCCPSGPRRRSISLPRRSRWGSTA